jgi:hypothetical protein
MKTASGRNGWHKTDGAIEWHIIHNWKSDK